MVDQRMDRRRPERFLYGTRGIVDGAMQRAKVFTVGSQAKRARLNTLHGIHRRNNLQHCELTCGPRALKSAVASALRPHQSGARKEPQNLSKVIDGDFRILRNFPRR
jgi:hypothetical protein